MSDPKDGEEVPRPPTDSEGRPRRPKDSEFFELPPDLKKKIAPGDLPATASTTPRSSPSPAGDEKPGGGKGGCMGLLLLAGGGLASLVAALA